MTIRYDCRVAIVTGCVDAEAIWEVEEVISWTLPLLSNEIATDAGLRLLGRPNRAP